MGQFLVTGNSVAAVATVSAATYGTGAVAPESIVAGFGTNFSTATAAAATTPLPQTLAGVSVTVKDALAVERTAPLFFVSPGQINYLIPSGTALGDATVTVKQGSVIVASGSLPIAGVVPGLFAANANGQGIAAANLLRVKADGTQLYEPVAQFDQTANRFVAVPIDLGAASDQLFLVGFGTGFRYRSALTAVSCTIGGTNAEVFYAGEQGGLVGLDQANIKIPRNLAGRGTVDVVLRVDGKAANTVTINVK